MLSRVWIEGLLCGVCGSGVRTAPTEQVPMLMRPPSRPFIAYLNPSPCTPHDTFTFSPRLPRTTPALGCIASHTQGLVLYVSRQSHVSDSVRPPSPPCRAGSPGAPARPPGSPRPWAATSTPSSSHSRRTTSLRTETCKEEAGFSFPRVPLSMMDGHPAMLRPSQSCA